MELKRVVVTGLGALTPLGNTAEDSWNGMVSGKSGAAPITLFDASVCKTQFACEVKGFDPTPMLDRKEARKMDRFAQMALWVTKEALEDAKFDMEHENKERMGVVWGSGMGGLTTLEESLFDYGRRGGAPMFTPFFIPKVIISMGAGQISLYFGLKGPSFGVTSACATSSHALSQAFDLIRLGKADVVVSGGSGANITVSGVGGFNSMHAISTRNDSPETASRPFSKSRDGFVMAEGAACLILEEYEHAKARGAHIYAEMAGVGLTSDAYHMTAPDPTGAGAQRVMQLALEDAGLKPEDIDYINTHGTSTPLGDVAELKAIQAVFGEHAYNLNIDSTKSMTGHMLGAAGAVEAFACVKAIENDIVPPTINHEDGDEDENIDYKLNFTFGKAQKRPVRAALSNTFGFGGHNAALIFKKYEA